MTGRKNKFSAVLPPSFLTLLSACLPPVLASPHTEYPAHQNGELNGRAGSLPDACSSSSSCFAISSRSTKSKCHKRTNAHGYTANVHRKYSQKKSQQHVCVIKIMRKQKETEQKGTPFHEMLCHSLGQPRKYSSIEALRSQCCVACSACVGARVRDRGKDV